MRSFWQTLKDLGDVLLALHALLLRGDHVAEALRPEPVHVGHREGLSLLHLDLHVRLPEVVRVGQVEVVQVPAGKGRHPLPPDGLSGSSPRHADVENVALRLPRGLGGARGDVGDGGGVVDVGHDWNVARRVQLGDVAQVTLLAEPVVQAATRNRVFII